MLAVAGAVLAGAASDGASEVAGRFTRGIVERIALSRRFCGLARRLSGLRTPELKGVSMRHRVPRRVLDYRGQKSAFSVSKGGSRGRVVRNNMSIVLNLLFYYNVYDSTATCNSQK